MTGRAFVSRFSPNRTSPEVLEAIFVQRHKLAEVWLDRLRDSVLTGVKHHLLAVGPRGCGKSHLVALLVSRLRKDPAVRERARIAWLPEDETTPSFWKFLLRILRALNAEYGDEFPPPPRERLVDATDDRRAAVLIEYLLAKLKKRTLVVVVENLDEVMEGLRDEGQKRWRAFLQEHSVAATLATSQQLTEDVSDRERPFFNFFQIEHLQPLTADEAVALLRKIAEHTGNTDLATFLQTPTGRARVRAIRHIAGGSHRVFIILSEFATRESLDDLVTAFEELLDELTPYYQERLRWLPDQQREIVEFLCRQVRTVPVKEIAGELFLTEQTAAAQLKQLKDKGYVTAGSVGRESRYELAEPLMRLCVEVKDSQRVPIPVIIEFLRIWYEREQVKKLSNQFGQDSDLGRYLDAVLRAYDGEGVDLVESALDHDWEAAKEGNNPEEMVRIARDIIAVSSSAARCFAVGYELEQRELNAEAAEAWQKTTALEPGHAVAWLALGMVLHKLGRRAEAAEAFGHASKVDGDYPLGRIGQGAALSSLDQHEEALAAFNEVVEQVPEFAPAWVLLGMELKTLGRHTEALEAFDRATQIVPEDDTLWRFKGETLADADRHMDAIDAFDRALRLKPDDPTCWLQKGRLLLLHGRTEEALESFTRFTVLKPNIALTWQIKGKLLGSLGRDDEALAAFDQAIELDPTFGGLWEDRGVVLSHLGRDEEALQAFDRAIELKPDDPDAWRKKGICRLNQGDDSGGMADVRRAMTLDPRNHSCAEVLSRALTEIGRWNEVWKVLEAPYRQPSPQPPPPKDESHLPHVLAAVFRGTTKPRLWGERVGRLVAIYAATKTLAYLGNALVWSLVLLDEEDSADALDAWVDVWQGVAVRQPDLSLATRLFGVGVRYLRTKDERVLLDLVQEERSILRDLFGLDGDVDA